MLSEVKYKAKYGKGLKILSPKQLLQILSIILSQVRAGNKFENLLNEIQEKLYSLNQAKENTKNPCNKFYKGII